MLKCFYCGSENMANVIPEKGDTFVITERTVTGQHLSDTGAQVLIQVCMDCKRLVLTLIGHLELRDNKE